MSAYKFRNGRTASDWRLFIENCCTGDNYFRGSEYRQLIADLEGAAADIEQLAREREADRKDAEGWLPIDTGPHTGQAVLLLREWQCGFDRIVIGHYANGWVYDAACERCGSQDIEPTHWMPLPAALARTTDLPQQAAQSGEGKGNG